MRAPSLLSSTAQASRGIWGVVVAGSALVSAVTTPEKVQQPVFDLEGLGMVGLAGDFSGVSQYEYTGQRQLSSFAEGQESLLSQLPNGLFTSLAGADGQINAMCVYETGGVQGIMIGGTFTSIAQTPANGLAFYNPETNKVKSYPGFTGRVNALLCDTETSTVYVGGEFRHEQSTNAIALTDDKWKSFPFLGFSGPVNTIAKSNNETILFGGSFTGLQKFVAPKTKHVQIVNLVTSAIEHTQTTAVNGFNDPSAITCTNDTSKQWLLEDGQVGAWTANFKFEIRPTKLRLINANKDGRGTREFRVTAQPLTGIMNLTYVDPETKERKYCEANCPLAQTDEIQDFEFVNNIGMKALRIDIQKFYGAGGGLSSVQLFQDEIFSYADPQFNEPACAPEGTRSNSTNKGTWESVTPETTTNIDAYVAADLDATNIQEAEIVFTPHVQESGEYVIKMFTPGCIQDNTCAMRGRVTVGGSVSKDGTQIPPYSYMQTNDFDKYDVIYTGPVDPAEDAYKPQITLRPVADINDQPADTVRIVGQKVQFQYMGNGEDDEDGEGNGNDDEVSTSGSSASGQLNGIYEYNPESTKTPTPSSSKINVAALSFLKGASVHHIIVKDDMAYVSGNFTHKDNRFSNFCTITQDGSVADVREGGVNAAVGKMLMQGDLIYLAGNFTQTRDKTTPGVNYVTAYDTKTSSWVPLGGGVNAGVTDISLINLNVGEELKSGLAVSGGFTQIQPGTSERIPRNVPGFAIWIPSEDKWMTEQDTQLSISGVISGYVKVGDNEIYAGSIQSNTMSASGMVFLEAQEGVKLVESPFEFSDGSSTSRKRAIPQANFDGLVSTGAFYEYEGKQWTVLGGNFAAKGEDGDIRNLAFIENETEGISGPTTDFSIDSNILTMAITDTQVWVGGLVEGTDDVSGLAVYDMATRKRAESQPQGITTDDGRPAGVYSITNRPGSSDMFVAGDYDNAGGIDCRNFCRYVATTRQWRIATQSVPGVIYTTKWLDSDHLLVGGNMTLNGTATYLAIYDATTSTFIAHAGNVAEIPGPITNMVPLENENEEYFAGQKASDGSPFILMRRNGEDFVELENPFTPTSLITDIEILGVSTPHPDTPTMSSSRVLLIAGALSLSDFGNASAVTFDGTTYTPFLLTTARDGSPGIVSSFFSLYEPVFTKDDEPMKKGYVILISLAIALALVFLIVLAGVAASYVRRRREGYVPAPTMAGAEKNTAAMQSRLPPADLFSHSPQPGRGMMI